MIRRLFLALLALCLALPAAASPALHCAPAGDAAMVSSHHHGHSQRHRQEDPPRHAQTMHDCIGCIAPLSGTTPAADARRLADAPAEAGAQAPVAGRVSGPDTPPPRA